MASLAMGSNVAIPMISSSRLLLDRGTTDPARVALIDASNGRSLTYGALGDAVRRLGSALARRGLRKGDVVCVCLTNRPETVIAMLGVINIGAVVTTLNPALTADEMLQQLNDARPLCMITSVDIKGKVVEIQKVYTQLTDVIIVDGAGGLSSFDELLKDDGNSFPHVHIDPEKDLAFLPYSSGTTGRPKGVMLTHYNIVAEVLALSHPDVALLGEKQVLASLFPLYHVGGLILALFCGLYRLNTVVLLRKFTFENYLQLLQTYKATTALLAPPVFVRLAKDPLVERYDLTALRHIIVGSAPLSGDVMKEFVRKTGITDIRQAYGMTEVTCLSHVTPMGDTDLSSAGKPIPNTECKISDVDSGVALGPNEKGEVWIRSPMVMAGYLHRSEATADTVDKHGWLHTGDIGYMDASGSLYIVDRLKELIKYKGYQVAPAELEALILRHPDVADVAVVGVPDANAGELPRAYVVQKANRTVVPRDVINFVQENVAPYKRLRGGVVIVDVIPTTGSGKMMRRALRELAAATPHINSRM